MFSIYRISGPESKATYIGYVTGDGTNALKAFLTGATRPDNDRNDVLFLAEHDNDKASLYALVIATEENEWEALLKRNEERAADPHSFSGPTMWPAGAYERAMNEDPTRMDGAKSLWNMRQLPTARDAYNAGMWSYAQIVGITTLCGRKPVLDDLEALTPTAFMVKYELAPVVGSADSK
jgi:hypothetical protein